eukprot:3541343-Prymnesium_polylepis.1
MAVPASPTVRRLASLHSGAWCRASPPPRRPHATPSDTLWSPCIKCAAAGPGSWRFWPATSAASRTARPPQVQLMPHPSSRPSIYTVSGANGSVRTCHFQDRKSCRKLGPEAPLEQPPPGQISAHDH